MCHLRHFLSLTLEDGRRLAWREYGRHSGYPVIFLHGNMNSRLFQPMWEATHEKTEAVGARLIAIDRAGYGESSYNNHASYSSGAKDIESLADHLNIDKFAVMGYSSGGPHALACASILSSRVTACGLVSSDGPYFEIGAGIIEKVFGVSKVTHENNRPRIEREYQSLLQSYTSLSKTGRMDLALADLANATAQGLDKGPAQDALLETRPWEFDSSGLAIETLLWHGKDDKAVPVDVAKYMCGRVPNIRPKYVDGESHSMIRRKWDTFLEDVICAARNSNIELH